MPRRRWGGQMMTIGESMEFKSFNKIARLSREMIITEKIDGTNGIIAIDESGEFQVGSRSRWITPEDDHFGFARWAHENKEELLKLGPGFHYGEWWGHGIQRGYNLREKRFSLFNVSRWGDDTTRPACCGVVPTLYTGTFDTDTIMEALLDLKDNGSKASPGFMKPEGVIIFHTANGYLFKKTIEKDEYHKGESA
jgi:hypothetical protein